MQFLPAHDQTRQGPGDELGRVVFVLLHSFARLLGWSIDCSLTQSLGHSNDLLVGRGEELEQLELLAGSVQRAFRPAPLLAERPRLTAQRRHSKNISFTAIRLIVGSRAAACGIPTHPHDFFPPACFMPRPSLRQDPAASSESAKKNSRGKTERTAKRSEKTEGPVWSTTPLTAVIPLVMFIALAVLLGSAEWAKSDLEGRCAYPIRVVLYVFLYAAYEPICCALFLPPARYLARRLPGSGPESEPPQSWFQPSKSEVGATAPSQRHAISPVQLCLGQHDCFTFLQLAPTTAARLAASLCHTACLVHQHSLTACFRPL